MNKYLILSKLFLFNEQNELKENCCNLIDYFSEKEINLVILCREETIRKLKGQIPTKYKKKINFINRGNTKIKKFIKDQKNKNNLFGVLGIIEQDAIFSFNCQIPLFNLLDSEEISNNKSSKIEQYGLPVKSYEEINQCFQIPDVHKNNYFELSFGDNFSVKSLYNANTYYQPEEEVKIKNIFKKNLKAADPNDRDRKILLLLLFHLLSEVATNDKFDKVDLWGTFPSSKKRNLSTSASFLKEEIRVMLSGKPRGGKELLIRKDNMDSKHNSGKKRLKWKCDKDFDTLIVNPALKDKIKGKIICIIDDYITNGYSAEAAKHLLLKVGAKKVIFLSLGKFGQKYYSTRYKICGDVSKDYKYKFISENPSENGYNNNSIEIKNLGDYID